MLYRVAVETGLRANELRSLTRASFDLSADPQTVTVAAAYSKHRREDVVPLRLDTAAALAEHLAAKLPGAPAFTMPNRTAEVIRADLEAAGIDYRDDAGRVADFHSLRHTTGSWLAAAGVHPKVAQTIMRHSTIDLTMSRYTHVFRGQEADAVAALPDLSACTSEAMQATGTDDAVPISDSPESRRSRADGKGRVSSRQDTRNAAVSETGTSSNAFRGAESSESRTDDDSVLALRLALRGVFGRTPAGADGRQREKDRAAQVLDTDEKRPYSQDEAQPRWDDRVDEGGGLENRCGESHRGFESLSHRPPS
jgi:hypothetical protein